MAELVYYEYNKPMEGETLLVFELSLFSKQNFSFVCCFPKQNVSANGLNGNLKLKLTLLHFTLSIQCSYSRIQRIVDTFDTLFCE